jgi:hypothetical protein
MVRDLICWIALCMLLSSCSAGFPSQQGQNVEIIYSNGGCLMIVDGVQVEQIREKEKEWLFDENCKISVRTDVE